MNDEKSKRDAIDFGERADVAPELPDRLPARESLSAFSVVGWLVGACLAVAAFFWCVNHWPYFPP